MHTYTPMARRCARACVCVRDGARVRAVKLACCTAGGRTPLHQAAAKNHKAVAHKLIELGADPHLKDLPYKPNVNTYEPNLT